MSRSRSSAARADGVGLLRRRRRGGPEGSPRRRGGGAGRAARSPRAAGCSGRWSTSTLATAIAGSSGSSTAPARASTRSDIWPRRTCGGGSSSTAARSRSTCSSRPSGHGWVKSRSVRSPTAAARAVCRCRRAGNACSPARRPTSTWCRFARPDGLVGGTISIEASCVAAAGHEFIWEACNDGVQLCADIAAPYLCTLPTGRRQSAATDELLPVVGPSTANLIEMLRVFARQEETLLLGGPTGAGKSRLARWCHEQSRRAAAPFEVLDLLDRARGAPDGRAVRLAARRLHRRGQGQPGRHRARAGRHAVHRRDRQALAQGPGRPAARAGGAALPPARRRGRRAPRRRALHRRHQRRPARRRCARGALPRGPLLPDQRAAGAACRRWPSGSTSCRCGRTTWSGGATATAAAERRAWPRRRSTLLVAGAWPGNLRQLDNVVRRAYALALHDRGGAAATWCWSRRHVERALAYEDVAEPGSLARAALAGGRRLRRGGGAPAAHAGARRAGPRSVRRVPRPGARRRAAAARRPRAGLRAARPGADPAAPEPPQGDAARAPEGARALAARWAAERARAWRRCSTRRHGEPQEPDGPA